MCFNKMICTRSNFQLTGLKGSAANASLTDTTGHCDWSDGVDASACRNHSETHKRPNGILGRDGFTVLAHYYGKELVLDCSLKIYIDSH